jgi:hypothetical protein
MRATQTRYHITYIKWAMSSDSLGVDDQVKSMHYTSLGLHG